MTSAALDWRTGKIPENTTVFAIGDIHGHNSMLVTMLEAVEEKIRALPMTTTARVIFMGDNTDRGPNSPRAIDLILDFRSRMEKVPNVIVNNLCGNHDEYTHRIIAAERIVPAIIPYNPNEKGELDEKRLWSWLQSPNLKEMPIDGFWDFLVKGGGYTAVKDYFKRAGKEFSENDLWDVVGGKDAPRKDADLAAVNKWRQEFVDCIPPTHQQFFADTFNNMFVEIGDYIFTHAGADPGRTWEAQRDVDPNNLDDHFTRVMYRNGFLWGKHPNNHWVDNSTKWEKVIVHGHTPSVVRANDAALLGEFGAIPKDADRGPTLPDGQKPWRLCVDTCIFDPKDGALTCFVHDGSKVGFMSVQKRDPNRVVEYSVVGRAQERVHKAMNPQLHPQPA